MERTTVVATESQEGGGRHPLRHNRKRATAAVARAVRGFV
jgi:hypothetical protein